MFEGFDTRRLHTSGAEIALVTAGDGPPLLLVHGYPQTHVIWHRVAPRLAERFTVVAPDLRGYGDSSKPPAGLDYAAYSKRAMAEDLIEVMSQLGFETFDIVGHDRGGRVAYRLALDHPLRVRRLVTLDILPTIEQFEAMSWPFAPGAWLWLLLSQPSPFPETLILGAREHFLRHMIESFSSSASPQSVTAEAMDAYLAAFTEDAIRASCDDYRAHARTDCRIDAADREARRRIEAPMLALWGNGAGERDLLPTWRKWATNVRGHGIPCGHFIPEEHPEALLSALDEFLTSPA